MDTPAGPQVMAAVSRLEVINTGTELLFGSVVNTHVTYLGQRLFSLGLRIQRQTTVPDGHAIRDAIVEAAPRADALIITGGLGPTSDDITRDIVAELTGRPLRYVEAIFAGIRARFERRGLRLTDRISRQAFVPEGATVLENDFGTAPGLYVPATGTWPHLFLLPGPPRELRPMFEHKTVPLLRGLVQETDLQAIVYRLGGLGESYVEEMVGRELEALPGLEVGYCARIGAVDLRLIGKKATLAEADRLVRERLAGNLVTTEDKEFQEVVVQQLIERGTSIAVAESCTGGHLADRITDVPGASEVFLEGHVTYSNAAKESTLGVPGTLLASAGAVSGEVAAAMAEGVRARANAHFGMSTTGIAGPGGGTPEKPAGTVFVGLAEKDAPTQVEKLFFPTDRQTFKQMVSQYALDLLRRRLASREP
ncbi:MAG: competence/damage-inducible protein A [Verrucomicrobia bacterium]|nr:competence/damage-inducible protein A [Verrucomicrobiota bacterium]